MWRSFLHEFFPAARRARLKRAPERRPVPRPHPLSFVGRLRELARLWLDWTRRRAWLHCDHPPLHAKKPPKLGGILEIQGWAVAVDGIESVTLTCDGSDYGRVSLGVRRPELARRFPHVRRVARNGFYHALDTRALADGYHDLTLNARTRTGRTVRVSGRIRVANLFTVYERWRQQTTPNAAAIAWMRRNTPRLESQPVVSLLLPVRTEDDLAALPRTVDSVRAQAYPHWQLVVACDDRLRAAVTRLAGREPDDRVRVEAGAYAGASEARNAALGRSTGELFAPLDPGDVLTPEALFEIVYRFNRSPDDGIVYSDEEAAGYPVFKPDWSPRLLLGVNYVGRFWAARRQLLGDDEAFRDEFGPAAEYELLLRLTERARSVGYVPAVLLSRPGAAEWTAEDARAAVQSALRRRGIDAAAEAGPVPNTLRVRHRLPAGRPLVTVLIEGTDTTARRLLDSLSLRTSYPDHELRLVGAAGPGLAERLNKAADAARGDYLLFVRAAAVYTDDWIEALLEHAASPEVGAVGGHLQDASGRTVDAGLVLLEDDRLLMPVKQSPEPNDPGTVPLLAVSRDCSAVSRDCLMVRRELFLEMGGFDERLDGRLIDADFCLHARAKGYAVVSTPLARLRAAGGEPPPSAAAVEVYRARWGAAHERGDPFFSPNFSRRCDGFRVNDEPTLLTHAPFPLIDRDSVRRVLAVKLDHVGDVQLAVPAIRRLRELFPEAELTVLVGPHTRSVVEREPGIDRVLTYEFYYPDSNRPPKKLTNADRAGLRDWLRGYGFDLAVDLRRETDSREVLLLSGARWTAGFADPGEAEWLTVLMPCEGPVRLLKPRRHMAQEMLRLVDMVARVMSEPPALAAPPPAEEEELVGRLFDAVVPAGHRLLIGIHPGSGRPVKCWPAAYFGRLAGMCVERLGAAVVVFGGPDEVKLAAEVIRHAPAGAPVVSLAGRFGLAALAAAVRRCDLFIGNDSGPTHLAATTGVPVLGVFAGTADPAQWGPLGPAAASVQRALLCSPCYMSWPRDCVLGVTCTRYLHPEPVFEAAIRVLLPNWEKLSLAKTEDADVTADKDWQGAGEMEN
jgi:ADP-heptose:LPS heptosyltransferase